MIGHPHFLKRDFLRKCSLYDCSVHPSILAANNWEPIAQSAEANQMNCTCNLELAWDRMCLVSLAVSGDRRIICNCRVCAAKNQRLWDSESRTSSNVGVNVNAKNIGLLFCPKELSSICSFTCKLT